MHTQPQSHHHAPPWRFAQHHAHHESTSRLHACASRAAALLRLQLPSCLVPHQEHDSNNRKFALLNIRVIERLQQPRCVMTETSNNMAAPGARAPFSRQLIARILHRVTPRSILIALTLLLLYKFYPRFLWLWRRVRSSRRFLPRADAPS